MDGMVGSGYAMHGSGHYLLAWRYSVDLFSFDAIFLLLLSSADGGRDMTVELGGGEGGEEYYAEEFIVDGGGCTLST